MRNTLPAGAQRVVAHFEQTPNTRSDPPWARALVRSIHKALGEGGGLEGKDPQIARAAQMIDAYRSKLRCGDEQQWASEVAWLVCSALYPNVGAIDEARVHRMVESELVPWMREAGRDLRPGGEPPHPNFAPSRLVQDARVRRRPPQMHSAPRAAADVVVRLNRPVLSLPGRS